MEEGKRFSQLYLKRGEPVRDSQRFRNRLSAYFGENFSSDDSSAIAKVVHRETGVKVPYSYGYELGRFLEKAEVRDVLDTITIVYLVAQKLGAYDVASDWKRFVERAMREENVGYRLDSKCGVHYFVDEEFERNRVSTLAALDDPKLNGVRDAYEAAYRHMDSDPLDTKAAVRSMFESFEILVRQMIPKTKNLNRWLVENPLKEKSLTLYENEPTAANVVSGLFDGFADWVDALHNYRHGQPSEQPVAPTEEVAVYVLSSGSAFLRWLVGISRDLESK